MDKPDIDQELLARLDAMFAQNDDRPEFLIVWVGAAFVMAVFFLGMVIGKFVL